MKVRFITEKINLTGDPDSTDESDDKQRYFGGSIRFDYSSLNF